MDNNSTSVIDSGVHQYFSQQYGNPSSLHAEGRKARDIIENSRSNIMSIFNCQDAELVFTSSCTEANNMLFNSFNDYQQIISSVEHASILHSAVNPIYVPVNPQGYVDLNVLKSVISPFQGKDFIVSIMLANNETGVIQPIQEASKLVHRYGGIMHTDAAQGCGKILCDMQDLDVDIMSVSAHKLGGPIGIGALIFKRDIKIAPLIIGGGQEKKLRGGTENIPAIAAFEYIVLKIPTLIKKMKEVELLRDSLESEIISICPAVKIFGQGSQRVPNTSCIAMPNVNNDLQLMHFDLNGIAIGKGSACSSGVISNQSYVLKAMGVHDQELNTAIRISLSYGNTEGEIEKFVKCWSELYNQCNPNG